ncbi:MAG: cohesin domain-containing protein [bacterium]
MATIKVNDTVSIKINIRDAEDVYGVSAYLTYPADAIEILKAPNNGNFDVRIGDFLGDDAVIISENKINSADSSGILAISYSLVGNAAEKTGDGLLFTIKARVLKAGSHKLSWGAKSEIISFQNQNVTSKFEELMFEANNNTNVNVIYIVVEKDIEEGSATANTEASSVETPAAPSST